MGVLLYADDKIFQDETPENNFYKLLVQEKPVIGIQSIAETQEVVNSVSSFDAIVLDWDFTPNKIIAAEEDGTGDVAAPETDETFDFLIENHFFSLIYIFSERDIENSANGQKLKEIYKERIQFVIKDNFSESEEAYKDKVISEIQQWNDDNQNLTLPIKWSQSINKGTQKVFGDLSNANSNWAVEIYKTVKNDGMDPGVFVIDLLQMILAEQLTSDSQLISLIHSTCNVAEVEGELDDDEIVRHNKSVSDIYSRLYYTILEAESPIMTGDICKFNDDVHGIIVSPECDMKDLFSNDDNFFELVKFDMSKFDQKISALNEKYADYSKEQYSNWKSGSAKDKKKANSLKSIFNQNNPRLHFLPSLPVDTRNLSSIIDFRFDFIQVKTSDLKALERPFKLNSPFIQQLRQRFLSYKGRIGVPALPSAVRDWNLS